MLFGVDGAVVVGLALDVVDFAVVNVVFAVVDAPDELPEPVLGVHWPARISIGRPFPSDIAYCSRRSLQCKNTR